MVYAVESLDNDADPGALMLDLGSKWQLEPVSGLPEGALGLRGNGWTESLPKYRGFYFSATPQLEKTRVLAVPYALWQNRGDPRMGIWRSYGTSC